MKAKEAMRSKQMQDLKNLVLHQEQEQAQKLQSYTEILNLCARYAKNDKLLMQKIRELKQSTTDSEPGSNSLESPDCGSGVSGGLTSTLIQETTALK